MPPLLEARRLHKSYLKGNTPIDVLRGIDLTIEEGDKIVIVGSSGAGKSTLLHLLGGLDLPTEGEVCFEGELLPAWSEGELARFRNRTLGFVFQFHHLLPLLSALENVMLPCQIARLPKAQSLDLARSMMGELGLEHRLHHLPSELSGGEQQRVAIARAMVLKPRVLMADEPTGNLDSETSKRVFDEILTLSENRKTTLIVVTHNLEFAGKFNRRLQMRDGKIHVENPI